MKHGRQAFGEFVRKSRIQAGFTLREAARRMDYSASYLSRVESGDERPSPKLIAAMKKEYGLDIERLTELASEKSAGAYGHLVRNSAELRALYRVGSMLDPSEVDDFLRKVLAEKLGLEGDDLESQLRDIKGELPRLRQGTEGLFAAEVRPRFLSRKQIAAMADGFLRKNGLGPGTYSPPTPIESLVESEPDIRLRIGDLDQSPAHRAYVLGMSRWGTDGSKEIVLNSALVESEDETSEYRLLFTLGHELFHALDHLPLMDSNTRRQVECFRTSIPYHPINLPKARKTSAQRAVERWRDIDSPPRRLLTNEDWREWQAQTFAACVLMPEWAIRDEFYKRTGIQHTRCSDDRNPRALAFEIAGQSVVGNDVYDQSLNRLFKVSAQAMAIRLLSLKLIT